MRGRTAPSQGRTTIRSMQLCGIPWATELQRLPMMEFASFGVVSHLEALFKKSWRSGKSPVEWSLSMDRCHHRKQPLRFNKSPPTSSWTLQQKGGSKSRSHPPLHQLKALFRAAVTAVMVRCRTVTTRDSPHRLLLLLSPSARLAISAQMAVRATPQWSLHRSTFTRLVVLAMSRLWNQNPENAQGFHRVKQY